MWRCGDVYIPYLIALPRAQKSSPQYLAKVCTLPFERLAGLDEQARFHVGQPLDPVSPGIEKLVQKNQLFRICKGSGEALDLSSIMLRSHVAALLMFNYALPTMLCLDHNPKQDRSESCSQELQCVTYVRHFRTSLCRAPRGGLEQLEHIRKAPLPLILFLLCYR
jgi:hypothetical protein